MAQATTPIYTLSLHDALPILIVEQGQTPRDLARPQGGVRPGQQRRFLPKAVAKRRSRQTAPRRLGMGQSAPRDRKSTRLNSSHQIISYAVFCLKKKSKGETNS